MPGLVMLKIVVPNSWLIPSRCQHHPPRTCSVGPFSVRPQWNGSAHVTEFRVHPGSITPSITCLTPGSTPLAHTSLKCANGSSTRHQSHSPGATFFVGTVCS